VSNVRIEHVLVPLDGSELALQALPTARALVSRFDAVLHTVTVTGSLKEEDRARRLAAAALDVPVGDDRVFVTTGKEPAEVIAQRASSLGECVVCLATHGRGRLSGALVGSTARSVVQQVTDPVIALGPMADNPGWTPRPRGWPEPLSVRRIVACVDGSEASEQVLPFAAAWARTLDMALTITTVVDDTAPMGPRPEPADRASYIDSLVESWRSTGIEVDGQVLRDPIGPASAIRKHLDQRPAGLVALTTHARSGMQRLRFGATAASIVHGSVAPCLVAPVHEGRPDAGPPT
jgi:nucleotide-binding universal stress UspA family protein